MIETLVHLSGLPVCSPLPHHKSTAQAVGDSSVAMGRNGTYYDVPTLSFICVDGWRDFPSRKTLFHLSAFPICSCVVFLLHHPTTNVQPTLRPISPWQWAETVGCVCCVTCPRCVYLCRWLEMLNRHLFTCTFSLLPYNKCTAECRSSSGVALGTRGTCVTCL